MSYCRFSDGDIYLYPDCDGYINCQCCSIAPKVKSIFTVGSDIFKIEPCNCLGEGCEECMIHGDTHLFSQEDALEHIRAHRERGDFVPQYADEHLLREIKERVEK